MLMQWLTPDVYQEFVRCRAGKQAFAAASVPGVQSSLFDWSVLDRVLAADPPSDLIVVRRSELLELPAPATEQDVRSLFARGAGVVVRRAQRHDAGLAALARGFAREFQTDVHIQLFVTPPNTHGFGWHYDFDDVVILQTLGQKQYYFRANTVSALSSGVVEPDFTLVSRETSPLMQCVLHAGDLLYLPRGMWHVARARSVDALSISLGLIHLD